MQQGKSINEGWIQQGNKSMNEKRIHQTQKPVNLVSLDMPTIHKGGGTVLDTHVGSASSLIAYEENGLSYVGFEIDRKMYEAATKRLEEFRAQISIFVLSAIN